MLVRYNNLPLQGGSRIYYDMIYSALESIMKQQALIPPKPLILLQDLYPLTANSLSKRGITVLVMGGGPIGHYLRHLWSIGLPYFSFFNVLTYPFSAMMYGYNPSYIHAVKRTNYVIVPSFFAKKWFGCLFGDEISKKVFVIWPYVKPRSLAESDGDKTDEILVLARFSPEKKLEDALKLFSYCNSVKSARLILSGYLKWSQRWYYKQLIDLSKKLKIYDNCVFYSNVPEVDKHLLFRKAKILIHPTPNGLFEIAPLEAMSWGVIPLINAKSTIVSELNIKKPFVYHNLKEGSSYLDSFLNDATSIKRIQTYVKKMTLKSYENSILMAKEFLQEVCS